MGVILSPRGVTTCPSPVWSWGYAVRCLIAGCLCVWKHARISFILCHDILLHFADAERQRGNEKRGWELWKNAPPCNGIIFAQFDTHSLPLNCYETVHSAIVKAIYQLNVFNVTLFFLKIINHISFDYWFNKIRHLSVSHRAEETCDEHLLLFLDVFLH